MLCPKTSQIYRKLQFQKVLFSIFIDSALHRLLNFSSYKQTRRMGHISFERWDPQLCLEYKKTFTYNFWKLRYKQIKMEYYISKILNIGQSSVTRLQCQTPHRSFPLTLET